MRLPVVVAAALAALSATTPAAAPQSGAIVGVLTRYDAGHHEAAIASLLGVPDVAPYARMIQEGGPAWIAAAPDPAEARRRRLMLATVVLEMTHGRLQEDWADLRGLVEWTCTLLRAEPPGDDELLWQRAALALVEGAYDWRFLAPPPPPARPNEPPDPDYFDHAAHIRERYPDDERFALAEAMVLEARAPREPLAGGPSPTVRIVRNEGEPPISRLTQRARAASTLAIEAYGRLVSETTAGAEARLRMGYLQYRIGGVDEALTAFAEVAAHPEADAFTLHLAHFFTARALERQRAVNDAEAAYRRALDALPGAQSATLALSAILVASGRPDEAYALMDASAAIDPQPADPWRIYGYGDFRFWPELIGPLRAQVSR